MLALCVLTLLPQVQEPPPNFARDLLLRAAEAQRPKSANNRILHFSANLNLRERGKSRNEVDLQISYVAGKEESLILVLEDPNRGVRVAKGLDAKGFWLQEDGGERVPLEGREFAQDRRAIEDALEMSARLLLLLDLGRLPNAAQKLGAKREGNHWLITGTIPLRNNNREWALLLEEGTLAPLGLQITLPIEVGPNLNGSGTGPKPRTQKPWFEFRAIGSFEGLRMPQVIREFEKRPHDISKSNESGVEDREKSALTPVRILEVRRLEWR